MSNQVIEENNLISVDSLSFGDGYDWAEMEVFYSKEQKRFYWISGYGCSCTWLWDDVRNLSDMESGDRKAAADSVRRFAEDNRGSRDGYEGDLATAASGVLSFRSPK